MNDDDRAAALRNRPPVSQIPTASLYHRWETRTASGTWEMISRINWSQCRSCGELLREWEDLPPPRCAKCDPVAYEDERKRIAAEIRRQASLAPILAANRAKLLAANSPPPPVDAWDPKHLSMPIVGADSSAHGPMIVNVAPAMSPAAVAEEIRAKATAQAAMEACTSKSALSTQSLEPLKELARFDGYIQRDTGDLRKAYELAAFTTLQREAGGKALEPDQKARASAEWSAQLRLKVEAAKERDREAARHTPYWSPEEQGGGDL